MSEALELADIQGLVARGYGGLPEATFLLLAVEQAAEARRALRQLAPRVTSAMRAPEGTALNIAFTGPGVLALIGASALHPGFGEAFASGMTSPYRSRILGDVDGDDPSHWAWGGTTNDPVHVLVLLYAQDVESLAVLVNRTLSVVEPQGLRLVVQLATDTLSEREHFGFKDGISQPLLEGLGGAPTGGEAAVRAGEFVLGYVNEYGQRTYRPLLSPEQDAEFVLPRDPDGTGYADLGRNGTYLVFRQLEQDVEGFWSYVDRCSGNGDRAADPESRERFAAKLVGRWPSGAPLVLAAEHDDVALADANDFGYHREDELGRKCPIAAHIRRTNPRDFLEPGPGTSRSLEVNRRHRLLRRGRNYSAGGRYGVNFLCLGANLSRQYEFIQHTWVNDPSFAGLYDSTDALVGPRHGGGGTFVEPRDPVRRRYHGLPQFVSVRGGGYFFLPGIRALRYLLDETSARRAAGAGTTRTPDR